MFVSEIAPIVMWSFKILILVLEYSLKCPWMSSQEACTNPDGSCDGAVDGRVVVQVEGKPIEMISDSAASC